jgi:hypothetical protein
LPPLPTVAAAVEADASFDDASLLSNVCGEEEEGPSSPESPSLSGSGGRSERALNGRSSCGCVVNVLEKEEEDEDEEEEEEEAEEEADDLSVPETLAGTALSLRTPFGESASSDGLLLLEAACNDALASGITAVAPIKLLPTPSPLSYVELNPPCPLCMSVES